MMMFKMNEGAVDRLIRVLAGIVLLYTGYFYFAGAVRVVFYVLAFLIVATGAVGYCGLYQLMGWSTIKAKQPAKPAASPAAPPSAPQA